MVAESVPARRPVLPLLLRALGSRTPARFGALLLAALTLLVIGGPAALIGPVAPAAAVADAAAGVTVSVAPTGSAFVSPGQDLAVTVTVTNGTSEPVGTGTLHVYLAERALTSQGAVTDWIAASNASGPGDLLQSFPTRGEIAPGTTSTIGVTVPAASVGLGPSNAWGARGIAATLEVAGNVVAEGRGTFIWQTGAAATPVNVAVAVPITTPAGASGLIPAAALETYTGPAGLLTRQLEGVINRPVAIGIDPMIIASIRVLGDSAPPSAVAWLDSLAQASNDIFPLSYADSDISLEVQAGSGTLLTPIAFDHAIDASRFTAPRPSVTPTPEQGDTESPAPGQTPPAGTVAPPTTEELLAWDYTFTDVGWPAEGSVAEADLPAFTANGLTTSILAESQVTRPDRDPSGNAMVTIGGHRGLVSDDNLSRAVRRAATATSDAAWASAVTEAIARLAVVSADAPDAPRTLLATLERGWPQSSERVRQTLDALAGVPWERPVTLTQALAAGPTSEAALEAGAEPAARLSSARLLLQREAELNGFSSAIENPGALTGAYRLNLLGLLGTSWARDPEGWQQAVAGVLESTTEVLRSVTVTTKGPINVLATQVDIPVTLNNSFDQRVNVRVQLVPSNGRLVVGSAIEAAIDAESARTIKVPVSAKVGNGDVTLRVSVYSPTGVLVSQPGVVDVNVQAEWEGLGAAVFAVLVVLFFGFGVWRNIARRRKERAVSNGSSPADAADPVAEDGTATSTTTESASALKNESATTVTFLAPPVRGSDSTGG